MAEVYPQKRATNIWPWIVTALVVGLIIWFVSGRRGGDDVTVRSDYRDSEKVFIQSEPPAPPIVAYIEA